jgi:hypothetical protein
MKQIIGIFLTLKENTDGSFFSKYKKPVQLVFNLPTYVLRAPDSLPQTGWWNSESQDNNVRTLSLKLRGQIVKCRFEEDHGKREVRLHEGNEYAVFTYR